MKLSYSLEMEPHELIAALTELRLFTESLLATRRSPVMASPRKAPVVDSPRKAPVVDSPAEEAEPQAEQDETPVEEAPVENATGALPKPQNDVNVGKQLNLPKLAPEVRAAAKWYFREMVMGWAENFDTEGAQPDRLKILTDFGSSKHLVPVLIMAYEKLSLQRLILDALCDYETEGLTLNVANPTLATTMDVADKLAMNMVQVSHIACPDLAGTYDYTTRWKR